jgi:peptide/nickel transport system permease protein
MKQPFLWIARLLGSHRAAMVGAICVCTIVFVAIVGPWVLPHDPFDAGESYVEPGAQHWLGTDSQGRDLLSRVVSGGRTTLRIALFATLLSTGLGCVIGAIAGYTGGKIDTLLMRLVDFAMSFPSFLLAMVVVAILGRDVNNVVLAVGIVTAPLFARQVRAEVIRIEAMEYITAARAIGVPGYRIVISHVLPNCVGPIVVLATLMMGTAILDVAGLTFLGLGGDPYATPEWGLILTQGWQEISKGTLQVTVPCLCIFATVLGFNLLGEGVRDQLDPKSKHNRGQ